MIESKLQDGYYWHDIGDGTPEVIQIENGLAYCFSEGDVPFTPTGHLIGPLVPPR